MAVFLSSALMPNRVCAEHQTGDCQENIEQINITHQHHPLRLCTPSRRNHPVDLPAYATHYIRMRIVRQPYQRTRRAAAFSGLTFCHKAATIIYKSHMAFEKGNEGTKTLFLSPESRRAV